ncbi:MBL fold metallo-hydrolase [Rhodobacteraceae bacterium 2CG4]|uniref:MBL fold metallo-hydrolase n=1 Tax=Halovulum marinum TaxID=2662447 RepID=A0A6L5YXX1_9RHOB|nr:MBL fold metallo-hydrolase [Halovulum marinum]MSU89097.1 MBL fold metallo-hydrolase [Halovulum marinum]
MPDPSSQTVAPGVRALTAPNPGPMTHAGTRTYLLGRQAVAVIDPGPDDAAHLAAILAALEPGARITHILVTHAHRDHSAAAPALRAATGAPVLAFGPPEAGRSPMMAALAARGDLAGGEGIDRGFRPDRCLRHGEVLAAPEWTLEALHTPGHLSSHLSFALPQAGTLFTGDTVMGWSTTVISPPDGSVGAFRASMALLAARPERLYLPGHGAPVINGPATARAQGAHRGLREAQILAALAEGPQTVAALVRRLYAGLAAPLRPAAARNVLAHLLELAEQGRTALPDAPLMEAEFRLAAG